MSSTGVLPFVRGIDLSRNDFQNEKNFPKTIVDMTGLRWLKLNRVHLEWLPEELAKLNKLESLSLIRNNLVSLHGEITSLNSLRYLNVRENKLKNSGLPPGLFELKHLLVLDLSRNQLREVPVELEHTKGLLVLNLNHNQIETVPNQLFINLIDLMYLDLSYNKLETLPPQLRRLVNLQTLDLSYNPLGNNQLRQLPSLVSLRSLNLRNTQRTLVNLPPSLESSVNLTDLDLSDNQLESVPPVLNTIPNLRRLNLSGNYISSLDQDFGSLWKNLNTLNLSRNKLKTLPSSICRLVRLRRLYVSYNEIDFDGIPSGIGKLANLEVFIASNNNLEMIPEGVVRCGRLKKLNLSHNRLITLPDAIHLLSDLEVLDLSGNPDLIMPPKPPEYQYYSKGSGIEYYNIDFSLKTQLRMAGAVAPKSISSPTSPSKDPLARKMRLRRRHRDNGEDDETNQAKVLKGMSELARERDHLPDDIAGMNDTNLKPKRWEDALEKPPLDYSDIFDEGVGQLPGLSIWEIENFLPNLVDEALHGKFYEGDCYIILKTDEDENQSLNWQIYFWIGSNAPLDKRACSAIHAVNLRNFLGAQCRTIREEQGEESEEFLQLFPDGMMYIEGGRTASGFFTVEEAEIVHRMYRLHELQNKQRQLYLETVAISTESLDSRFVFVLDAGYNIFVWHGEKSKNTMRQKARLLAEKINKEERKNKAEIVFCSQGDETTEFWHELSVPESDIPNISIREHVDVEHFKPFYPIVYKVGLGMGYLELPQVTLKEGKLFPSLLETKNVYILDCSTDLFVWLGRKAARLVKAAAIKLVQELYDMIKRPDLALITRCLQGNEPQVFKSKFNAWDDVIAVDFTRTADSVARTGANLHEWMAKQEVKIDTSALFLPRAKPMEFEEEEKLMNSWNDELKSMEAFVLEGKKFVRLPEEELGHFYSEDCYVFLCRYLVPIESESSELGDTPAGGELNGDINHRLENGNNYDSDDEPIEDFHLVSYFWQGRDASNMGWLTFTFDMLKRYQSHFEDKVEVVRTHQQQESYKFISHFKRKFIIHLGKRAPRNVPKSFSPKSEFFFLRSNGTRLATRFIQVNPDACVLNSGFCYTLAIPMEESFGTVYVWLGSKAAKDEIKLVQEITSKMYSSHDYIISVINEGEEPTEFWDKIGGRKSYETDASFMQYSRLFRCSNDKGYFYVSEKCTDFCQDDLADEDIMILDNGNQVFVWVGSRCSDVEIKLALKSAGVYVQNMRIKQPERPRQLMLTFRGKETRKFSKCFHGWMKHKSVMDPRKDYLISKSHR
ncbi:FLII actin remodeling protein [Brevipalpus obovatus]|uniref:FLII actin remodeling protein n=1 Tax=Brevipalpus obovatus TaxID=246614 RepID=UPI003D9F2ECB